MILEDVRLLIVDDDPGQRSLLDSFLSRQGVTTMTAESGAVALGILAATPVDMIISDVRMPGMSGMDLLKNVREKQPSLPVLLVTAYPYVKDAVEAMRDGAVNYLEKPIDFTDLIQSVRQALGLQIESVGDERPDKKLPENVIAESPAILRVLREAELVADSDSRVLVSGESGTGKEVIAAVIHQWSARASKPFIKVNCAALQDTLIESELFGHEKGAFTGATSRRIGRFEEADTGTILLDEISETSPGLQAKLLRVIQDGTFQRVGSNEELSVDVRIIATTNRHLEREVERGAFREDLFYRLSVIELYLPPLRERHEDLLPMANFFAETFSRTRSRLSNAAVTTLMSHQWPGNVRELRNAMERATLMAQGNVILPEHFPTRIVGKEQTKDVDCNEPGRIETMERVLILQTLRENAYNRSRTAQALGISRRALIYKLQRFAEMGHKIDE